MVANLKSLVIPLAATPQVDTSWLGGLMNTLGGAIDKASEDKSFGKLADQISGQPAQAQQPGFLGRLFGQSAVPAPAAQQQMQASNPAPAVGNASVGTPNDIQNQFIGTVQQGGLTNPYGLAAVAATGRAESGWSPKNVNAAWPDPSQSGQAGTAGGILSWRNERLANLRNFAQAQGEDPSNISPATQAKFFLQEDPTLVSRLNQAKSPQEASNIMANAWKFRGYDQPGGEAARRAALTQNYYATQFANAQPQASSPTQVASLDPSAGMPQPGAAAQMRASSPAPQTAPTAADFDPSTVTPDQLNALLGPSQQAQPGYVDPMVTTAYRKQASQPAATGAAAVSVPAQVTAAPAQATPAPTTNPGMIAAAQPATRQNISNDMIAGLVRDPNTRQVGLQLWQQVLTGKTAEPWQFITLPDGTLARANQATGAIESVGQFQKPKAGLQNVPKGGALYDENTGQWITPPAGVGGTNPDNYYGTLIKGYDKDGNPAFFQPGKDGSANKVPLPADFKPENRFEKIDLGTSWLIKDTTNGTSQEVPKDVQGEAEAKKRGTDIGEQQAGKVAAGSSLGSTLSGLDRLGASVDDLSSDPSLGKITGWEGMLPNLPGGKAAGVQARLNTLKSQIGFAVLQAMRDASKTGGALGNVSDQEGARLENNLAALSQAQSEGDLRKQLGIIRDYVNGAKARLSGAYKQMYGEDYAPPSASPSGNTTSSGVKWSIEK